MKGPFVPPKFIPLAHVESVAVHRSWFEMLRSEALAAREPHAAIAFLNRVATECERALEVGQ